MISDDYIMGFVEGEGCFSIAISKHIDRKPRKTKQKNKWKKPGLGFRVSPSFRVSAVSEEEGVLFAIKERLGVGEVYSQKRTGNRKDCSQYYVQTIGDLDKIEEFFSSKHFYTTKGDSFKLWCQCLTKIREKRHLTKEGLLEICKIRDQMNPKLGGKNNRTTEMVEKILELQPEHIEVHASQTKLIHNKDKDFLRKWLEKKQGHHKITETDSDTLNPSNSPK